MELPDLTCAIEETSRLPTLEAVGSYFLDTTKALGFDVAGFHVLRRGYLPALHPEIPLIHNFPDEWYRLWLAERFFARDPVNAVIPYQRQPFHWHEVGNKKALRDEERDYLAILRDFGFTDGIQLPLFGPNGEVVGVPLACMGGRIEISPEEMKRLHHFVYHVYNRMQELRLPEEDLPELSPREKEILTWVSMGKSNSIIGDILSISEHTVDSLLRRAFRKLGVSNRIGAVIKAAQHGLIALG